MQRICLQCRFWLVVFVFHGGTFLAAQENTSADGTPSILIRPANYDPLDEWAYTRSRGEVAPGHAAGGLTWNGAVATTKNQVNRLGEPQTGEPEGPNFPGATPIPVPTAYGSPYSSYAAAYAAVPFSRAEYEANPGYRHEAALELLMGTLRPTTVVNQRIPYASRYPDFLSGPQLPAGGRRLPMGYAPQLGRHGFWYHGIWYPQF